MNSTNRGVFEIVVGKLFQSFFDKDCAKQLKSGHDFFFVQTTVESLVNVDARLKRLSLG
jgi:hypothetical protein